jgi:hypothetical protein
MNKMRKHIWVVFERVSLEHNDGPVSMNGLLPTLDVFGTREEARSHIKDWKNLYSGRINLSQPIKLRKADDWVLKCFYRGGAYIQDRLNVDPWSIKWPDNSSEGSWY